MNPDITYQLNPAPTYTGAPINGWTLVGKDNNIPKKQFMEGDQLKVVWEVTTTVGGVDTTVTIDVIVIVMYHAW